MNLFIIKVNDFSGFIILYEGFFYLRDISISFRSFIEIIFVFLFWDYGFFIRKGSYYV